MSDIEGAGQQVEALSKLTGADIDRLIEIWTLGFPDTDVERVLALAPDTIANDKAEILVVRDGLGRIASTMIVGVVPGRDKIRGRIEDVATHPDQRRQGYAGKVMEFALDWFREQGANRVYLDSSDDRKPAHGLYRKFGFEIHETNEFVLGL